MGWIRECLGILLLTAIGAAYSLFSGLAPAPWKAGALAPGEIRATDAAALDPIWVDARAREAFEADRIDGAVLLNEGNWDVGLVSLMERWLGAPAPIVVYCESEGCAASKRIADRLRENLADAEIDSLKGGWSAWRQR